MAGRVNKRAERQEEGEERDEHGLTPWHYLHGRQNICGTCNQRPCADSCPEQWWPDCLESKAARAGLSITEWATLHADWISEHAGRPDVAAWLAQAQATGDRRLATEGGDPARSVGRDQAPRSRQPEQQERRRIPVDAAMAQAMAVVAGEARAENMVPVYAAEEA